MTKVKARHFSVQRSPGGTWAAACGITLMYVHRVTDRRKVTCENCKNSLVWKGRKGKEKKNEPV